MNKLGTIKKWSKERGQALVEAALMFPLFLIIIAGMVEVGQLVVTQNRVTDAVRASTRFAANGGQDEGMVSTVFNAVTGTLLINQHNWDIWSIRATINNNGDGFTEWDFTHIYGYSNTVKSQEVTESAIQTEVLTELQQEVPGKSVAEMAGGLEFVGTYAIHDVESILGLDAMEALQGMNSISELILMRVLGNEQDQTSGCSAFPVAAHMGIRSVTPPGQGANPYPDEDEFDYPDPPPSYEEFYQHEPNMDLDSAEEGDVFLIQNGFGSGNFGWLHWNRGRPASSNTLADSFRWPGDSVDYSDHGDNSIYAAAAGIPHIVRGYVEPGDSTDISMQIGDLVAANTGSINSNAVRTELENMIDSERAIRIIIWDEAYQQGNNGEYRIKGFAIMRLVGYHLSQGNGASWIMAEFVRLDSSCGQPSN